MFKGTIKQEETEVDSGVFEWIARIPEIGMVKVCDSEAAAYQDVTNLVLSAQDLPGVRAYFHICGPGEFAVSVSLVLDKTLES